MQTVIPGAGIPGAGKLAITAVLALGLLALGQSAFGQDQDAGRGDGKASSELGDASAQTPDKATDNGNQCIFFRTLYDWKALNNSNLIVWAPSRKHPYHLQLNRPCFGLRFAHSIGFTSRDSRLCGFGGDSVLVESGGGMPDRCPIGSITKLTEESLKALLAQPPSKAGSEKKADE
ncbi:MAG: hypothetical protein JNM81_10795 [Rhodospirillaceae bacterium]|nr:hypothetical protein [Rhodospirillaceae bacterium]